MEGIEESLEEGMAQQDEAPEQQAPPEEVSRALLPPVDIGVPSGAEGAPEPRFDISVSDAPAKQFFMSLVEGTPYNMVVHPDVAGEVSLTLKNVTIPEVMETVRDVYGYEFRRTTSSYQVLPRRLQTRIYQVNYLNVKRKGKSQTRVSSGQITQPTARSSGAGASGAGGGTTITGAEELSELSGSQVETESEADLWKELETALMAIVGTGDGRSVVITPQSGVVVVRAMPTELREVAEYLATTQQVVERQVILEAKILEVELSDGFQSGINWTALLEPGTNETVLTGQTGGGGIFSGDSVGGAGFANPNVNNSGITDPSVTLSSGNLGQQAGTIASSFGGVFALALSLSDFTAFIELLETQGNVQVLSSPRVSTVNNQKAVIKVGTDEFFVTNVSSTTIAGTTTTTTPSVTLTPFFSGIALDVIPQISQSGEVILHIHPTVSEVREQEKDITVAGEAQTLPLAFSSVRESDSIVRAYSNQIVVIGGLMQNTNRESVASTPLLGDLPFIGSLFRHTRQSARKSELVILLRPIVVDGRAWRDSLRKSSETYRSMDRGFHYGGKHEVFGSEAETRSR